MEGQDINIDYFDGISCIILVAMFYFIGLRLISKYFKDKQRNFIYVGLTWMGMCGPWIPPATGFLFYVITGVKLPDEIYFLIGYFVIPVSIITWLTAFTNFIKSRYKTEILIIYIIYGVVFEILFLIFLFTDISVIGIRSGVFQADLGWFILGYLLTALFTFLVTSIIFARNTMVMQSPETQLKGKFLLIAIISLSIGSVLDGFFTYNSVLFVIYKIILISSSLEFYFAFFLPNWLKNILKINDNS